MKKSIILASLMVLTLFVATPALAQTSQELQGMIESLSQRIQGLQFQLGAQASQSVVDVDPNPESTCVTLSSNLRYRSRDSQTNGDVSALQDFLQSQGYLTSEPTGYFGSQTLKAVKDFQKDNGISPTGFVGPYTRAKISALSCGKAARRFAISARSLSS